MKNQWSVIGLVLLLGGLAPAEAAAQECDRAITTREMEECLSRDLEDANSRLREAVELLGERLPGSAALHLLRTAQEQWEVYRATQCRSVYASFEGGSMAGIAYLGCSISLAKTRIGELDELYPPIGEGKVPELNGDATVQSGNRKSQ